MATKLLYEFGDFQVDPQERALLSDGIPLPLAPKAFDALLILVERGGSVVAKDDLQVELWPSVFVEENNLAQLISVLRKRLGDQRATPIYIQTIAKRGYRFCCPVRRMDVEYVRDGPPENTEPVPSILPPPAAIRSVRPGLRRGLWAGLAAAGLAVTLAAARTREYPIVSAATPVTVAVLPFEVSTGEPQGSLTGMALADDAIRHFGTDGGLRVLPISAVMPGRPEATEPTERARRLGANFVLTTQVTSLANGIQVRSCLVREADGSTVWNETRHVNAIELLAIEDDLTVSLRRALLGRRTPEPPPLRHITSNLAAYAAYMQGLTFLGQRTSEGTYKAIDTLQQAVADDPAFAQAEVALAEAYSFDLAEWTKAEPTARHALSLNPRMGEGHAVLGLIAMMWHNDFPEAGDQLRMALQSNPNDPLAHMWYGNLFAAQGRLVEASEELRLARDLDPYSDAVNLGAARIFYLSRKFDQARDLCLQILAENPEFLQAHILLHEVYVQQRQYDKAIDEFRTMEKLAGGSGLYSVTQIGAVEQAYGKDGIEGFWSARASYLEAGSYHDDYELAKYLARLGRKNEALERLQQAMETPRSPHNATMFARDEPAFDGLAADPRFVQLTAGH